MLKLILKSCLTEKQTRQYFPFYFLNILFCFQIENQTCTNMQNQKRKLENVSIQMVLDNKEHMHAPVIDSG